MTHAASLATEKKLTLTYRVEPGCLGPNGKHFIEQFCEYAQAHVHNESANWVILNIIPRFDKSLPEMQFNALSKKLSHLQAEKYLGIFGQSLDDVECHLSDEITRLITDFSGKFIK